MTALSIPLFAFFTVLTVLALAPGLRRLMGMRLSPLRTLIAALIALLSASPIALLSASPIITAMAGPALSPQHPGVLPGPWFVFLGVVIAISVETGSVAACVVGCSVRSWKPSSAGTSRKDSRPAHPGSTAGNHHRKSGDRTWRLFVWWKQNMLYA